MIQFHYETTFTLNNEERLRQWIVSCIVKKGFKVGDLNFIFCDDEYLHKLNVEFLKHDTLTDIISFDNTVGTIIAGDVFISIERVKENAKEFDVSFEIELQRVIIHGVLHFMGYKDKTQEDQIEMRKEENNALKRLSI